MTLPIYHVGAKNHGENPKRRKKILESDDELTDFDEMGQEDPKDCKIGESTIKAITVPKFAISQSEANSTVLISYDIKSLT